jgi:hypothetical protein
VTRAAPVFRVSLAKAVSGWEMRVGRASESAESELCEETGRVSSFYISGQLDGGEYHASIAQYCDRLGDKWPLALPLATTEYFSDGGDSLAHGVVLASLTRKNRSGFLSLNTRNATSGKQSSG